MQSYVALTHLDPVSKSIKTPIKNQKKNSITFHFRFDRFLNESFEFYIIRLLDFYKSWEVTTNDGIQGVAHLPVSLIAI